MTTRALTRRDFLAVSAGAALAGSGCQAAPYRRADFVRPAESPVVALAAPGYDADFERLITHGLRELEVDVRGKRVLLKPNLVEFEPGTVINTHPHVVLGAAMALRRAGAREVIVAEGPGHRRDVEYLLSSTGMLGLLATEKVPFVDLNHDDVHAVALRSWFTGLRELALPQALLAADVIVSMPKLKTHHWAGITCSMKNFFGVVPGAVYGWPKNLLHFRGIDQSILDIVATVRPHLAIVDGVVGMEGDGPIMGRPKAAGVILMGRDLVAVDATAARVMGLRPEGVRYLADAARFLGNIDREAIPMRGERLERFVTPFDVLPAFASLRA
jgi:uncharacterized protein (DUF362 family)